ASSAISGLPVYIRAYPRSSSFFVTFDITLF
ncbi:unnamed protein product, partial [marine sediment metagenome]